MSIDTKYQKINLKKSTTKLFNETESMANTLLPLDGVSKILALSSSVVLLNEEIVDKKIKYSARVLFNIVYLDSENVIKKTECGTEFISSIEKEDLPDNAQTKTTLNVIKNSVTEKNGNYYAVALIGAEIKIYSSCGVTFASGGEDMFMKKEDKSIIKSIKQVKSNYPVEEEFELNYAVGDVIMHQTELSVSAVTCGVGNVIVDGENILSLCLLQKTENSDILKEVKTIPFRIETEFDEAMPENVAIAEGVVNGVKIDVEVDEEKLKSKVKVSLDLSLTVEVYEKVTYQMVTDAYSQTNYLNLEKVDSSFTYPSKRRRYENKIVARGVFSEPLNLGARLMCSALEKINLIGIKTVADGVLLEGVAECNVFIKDTDGNVSSRQAEAPFTLTVDGGGDYTVELLTGSFFVKVVSLDSFDVEFLLTVTLQEYKKESFTVINKIEVGEEKEVSTSALSVYIPLKGEELWDVAKRLNSCPEVILEINSDLEFPLTGEERLLIYRQEKKNY